VVVTGPLLRVRSLHVTDPVGGHVLGPLDLDVDPGERVALVGASGAGKSQTLAAVLGLPADPLRRGGEVMVAAVGGRPATTGALLQESAQALDPLVRVGRQIGLPVPGRGRVRRARVRRLADDLGLDPGLLRRHPLRLSGGQRQRCALALALARDPDLLVVDEPTSALDAPTAAQVLDVVDRWSRASGAALLVATHDLGLVTRLCTRVVVLDAGLVVEEGPVRSVTATPRHSATACLVTAARQLGTTT